MLKTNGGNYSKADDWQIHIAVDGMLVTGQNPASSEATAEAVLKLLGK
jgi:putative intracellular protease/amidase